MSRPLPPGMLENGMPSGGTGAPPDKAARAAAQTAAITRNVPGTGGAAGLEAPSRMLCLKNLLGPEVGSPAHYRVYPPCRGAVVSGGAHAARRAAKSAFGAAVGARGTRLRRARGHLDTAAVVVHCRCAA
jgi:hypothetical protein